MSLLQDLEAMRQQVLQHSQKELPVPPDGRIVVRFRPPPNPDALLPVIAAYRMAGALNSDQATQLLVDCCDEILKPNAKTGDPEPYDPEGGPLVFDAGDERWGTDVKTARDCVAKLYNLDKQPAVLAGIADVLMDWLQGVEAAIARRAEGESASGADS